MHLKRRFVSMTIVEVIDDAKGHAASVHTTIYAHDIAGDDNVDVRTKTREGGWLHPCRSIAEANKQLEAL